MKQEKRDQIELLLSLLREMDEPVRRTHLLYKVRLNHYQLIRYVGLLLKLHMIEEVLEPFAGLVITEKGRLLLMLFGEVPARQDNSQLMNVGYNLGG